MSVINQIQVGSTTYDIQDAAAVPSSRKINSKALSSDITLAASDVGAVPSTRKVNNKALSSDITLTAADVGALASTYTAPVTSVNSQTGVVVLSIPSTAADVGAVPTNRTVNGKALSSNITLNAADVGALPSTYTAPVTSVNGATGAVTIAIPSTAVDVGALPSTHTVVRLYGVTCNANSAVGDFATVSNAAITANHIVANIVFSRPNYIRSDVIWVTTNQGTLTLNGRCYGATTADIILVYNDVLVS